jgi:hypothetical protein
MEAGRSGHRILSQLMPETRYSESDHHQNFGKNQEQYFFGSGTLKSR